jgi:hypothetical protein
MSYDEAGECMNEVRTSIIGIFSSPYQVEKTILKLKRNKVSISEISVIFPDQIPSPIGNENRKFQQFDGRTEGTTFGGPLGWLIDGTTYRFPEANYILVAGPLSESVAHSSRGQKIESLLPSITDLGFLQKDARKVETRVLDHYIPLIVSLADDTRIDRIESLLQQNGAVDLLVSSKSDALQYWHRHNDQKHDQTMNF